MSETHISFECHQCGRFYKVDEQKVGQLANCRDCGAELKVPVPSPISQELDPTFLPEPERQADGNLELSVADLNQGIADHIETHIGPVHRVWHEMNPGAIQVDIVQVAPTDEKPFWTLITLGMSHQRMETPDDAADYSRAELLMCLPEDWPLEEHDLRTEQNYWPIGLLKALAALPFQQGTWIGPGHTIPNGGDELRPYTHSTELCCSLLLPPLFQIPEEFHLLRQPNGSLVRFYSVWTLFPEEVRLKLNKGLEHLLEKFDESRITETVCPVRKNVAKKRRWFFRRQ